MPVLKMLAQFASVRGVLYLHRFESEAIVCAKTTNEYFQYLFELWGYSYTKSVRLGTPMKLLSTVLHHTGSQVRILSGAHLHTGIHTEYTIYTQVNSLMARCASVTADSVIASDAESVEAILMLPNARLAVIQ